MMAARFTEHAGDPQWLKDQRASAKRASPRPSRAMPYPSATPQHQSNVVEASPQQFVQGTKSNPSAAFVLGAIAGVVIARGRRR
jgi:hypothetical protein